MVFGRQTFIVRPGPKGHGSLTVCGERIMFYRDTKSIERESMNLYETRCNFSGRDKFDTTNFFGDIVYLITVSLLVRVHNNVPWRVGSP